jgi:hypothetical protein
MINYGTAAKVNGCGERNFIVTNESKLILEIWETFRDLIPPAKRDDAAHSLLRSCQEYGFDDDIAELEGEDDYLDRAIETLQDDQDMEDDDDE